jgi:adenine phosphoribosyltransferase
VSNEDIGARVRGLIRDVKDFPKPGIVFKDLTPVFKDGPTLRALSAALADLYRPHAVDAIVAIESRGFIVGTPMALMMDRGVVLVRKQGKLPGDVVKRHYDLEYGQDTLEVQHDAIQAGMRVVVVDDLLATGGTMRATIDLVREQGAEVVGAAFVVELGFLKGRERLADVDCHAVVQY